MRQKRRSTGAARPTRHRKTRADEETLEAQARQQLVKSLHRRPEHLETLRLRVSEGAVKKYLRGLHGLLYRGRTFGVTWQELSRAVSRVQKRGIEPSVENLVKQFGFLRGRYPTLGNRRKAGKELPRNLYHRGRARIVSGGGVGVGGRGSRRSRGASRK